MNMNIPVPLRSEDERTSPIILINYVHTLLLIINYIILLYYINYYHYIVLVLLLLLFKSIP